MEKVINVVGPVVTFAIPLAIFTGIIMLCLFAMGM